MLVSVCVWIIIIFFFPDLIGDLFRLQKWELNYSEDEEIIFLKFEIIIIFDCDIF